MHVVLCRLLLKEDGRLVFVLGDDLIDVCDQVFFLHGFQVEFIFQEDCVLASIIDEVMRSAFFPSVEDWFVAPLVILAAEHKGVLFPYQTLCQLESGISECTPECQAFTVCVEYVRCGS